MVEKKIDICRGAGDPGQHGRNEEAGIGTGVGGVRNGKRKRSGTNCGVPDTSRRNWMMTSVGKTLGIVAINVIAIILAIKGHRVSAWGVWALAVLLCVIE